MVSLDEAFVVATDPGHDLVALDDALNTLTEMDPRKGQVVEMRFFGGLAETEAAQALGVSVATLKRDWAFARAWLHDRLNILRD